MPKLKNEWLFWAGFAGESLEMNDGSHEFEFEAIWAVPV